MKTATERLSTLKDLLGEMHRRQSHLHNEIDEVLEEWEGIGRAGGQRDDHAALLLKRVQPHLDGLQQFFYDCNEQAIKAIHNPFGT